MRRRTSAHTALALLLPLLALTPTAEAAAPRCEGAKATIVGTNKADTLKGTGRADVIVGLGGNDRITGLGGNDRICGGAGDDLISGAAGADRLRGGAGKDRITSGSGTGEVVAGDGGHDRLVGGPGLQDMTGGAGNDVLEAGAGEDVLEGGAGNDTLHTGTGDLDFADGQTGNDRITVAAVGGHGYGGDGDDRLTAAAKEVRLRGDEGNDVLTGSPHEDQLWGGPGHDEILGGGGNDLGTDELPALEGGPGNDIVDGGDGDDVLYGGSGNDTLSAGPGAFHEMWGEEGRDWLFVESGSGFASGGDDDDTILAEGTWHQVNGDAGDDELVGGEGEQTLEGGPGADTITGGEGSDVVDGGTGDDDISGEGGDDTLFGKDGVDQCSGGAGTDLCDGGSPGGPDNSPLDVDECDDTAETKVSCREEGLPERWAGTISGTTVYAPSGTREVTEWSLDVEALFWQDHDDQDFYRLQTGKGSYSVSGYGGSCSHSGGGAVAADDIGVDLRLHRVDHDYYFEFHGWDEYDLTRSCPDGTYVDPKAFSVTGRAELQPWDPDRLQVGGSGVNEFGDTRIEFTWDLSPVR